MTNHDEVAEVPKRREAFDRYVRMKPRSLRRLAAEIRRSSTTVERWSKDGKWQERVERWDAAAAVADYEAWAEEVSERSKEKRAVALQLLATGLQAVKNLHADELSASEALRYLRQADEMLDQVVADTRPDDPRELEALAREVASDAGIDAEMAIRDAAAMDEAVD